MDERSRDIVDRRHGESPEVAAHTSLYGNLKQTRDEVRGFPRARLTVADDPADPVHGYWDSCSVGAAHHHLRDPLALRVAGRELVGVHWLVVLCKHLTDILHGVEDGVG